MAQFTLKIGTETTDEVNFTPSSDITIDAINNNCNLPLNFSEGDTITSGTILKANGSARVYGEYLDVIVDYTEI